MLGYFTDARKGYVFANIGYVAPMFPQTSLLEGDVKS